MTRAAKEGALTGKSWTFAPEGDALGAAPPLPAAGQTIVLGREGTSYEILRSLGSGGWAKVLLARRLGGGGFAREVALKCIAEDLEVDDQVRKAFISEARLASYLRHPNIAEAYELLEAEGRYYLVLEYVEGVSAGAVLQAARREHKRLNPGLCCHVAVSVAEALHYAHGLTGRHGEPLGIVHRDVTPTNIIIAASGAVKLVDFGVAYARMQGRERTRTGRPKGTYEYFSPEQAQQRALDGRSDLFSLGIVLLELLTGTRVFDAGSDLETIQRIADCPAADVKAVTGGLPKSLQAICERALAKRPADRFQDGAEFSKALRAYQLEDGVLYWPNDCVAEMHSLGLPRGASFPDGIRTQATLEPSHRTSPEPAAAAGLPTGAARWPPSRRVAPAWLAAAVVVVLAASGGTLFALRHRNAGEVAPPAGSVAAARSAERGGGAAGSDIRSASGQGVDVAAGVASAPVLSEPVVRPKRRARETARAAVTTQSAAPAHVVTARLPRGTLIPAKLLAGLDPTRPSAVEAVVAENVLGGGGAVLVPAGSTIICSSRTSKDGRVPVSCEGIKAADRSWSFSGLAVGEGQHVGLRVLDTAIPAGTSFVVYVDAEYR